MNGTQYLKALVTRHHKVPKKPVEEKVQEEEVEVKKTSKKTNKKSK